jgi:hypothetical protein
MKNLQISEVIEKIFTTPNTETGSLPPEKIAWVLFQNGTVFLTAPNDYITENWTFEELATEAKQCLTEFGLPLAGTPSADFAVSQLTAWYPNDYVYVITYEHPNIFNFGIYEQEETDIMVGLTGRNKRGQDTEELKIIAIRNFFGERQ